MSSDQSSSAPLLNNTPRNVLKFSISICKKLAITTAIYLLGFFGVSIAWVYLALIVTLMLTARWPSEKRTKWDIARAIGLGHEKEMVNLLAHMNHLPSWVHFPDIEKAEWLNRIIKQCWEQVNVYARDLVPKITEAEIQKIVPGFRFDQVDLGDVPCRVDGIKVYDDVVTSRDKIVMDLDVSYAGNSSIKFQVKGLKGGIENFHLRGRARVIMKPLISSLPLVGGIQVYFLAEPKIDFELTGVTQVMNMPGLRSLIEKSVLETINSYVLFPNFYPLKFSENVDTEDVKACEPEGILRVHLLEAKHLEGKDLSGKSDPYTILNVGPQKFRTKTIKSTLDPKWNYWCEFKVEKYSELKLHVWDEDDNSKDDSLGQTVISIKGIAEKGREHLWMPLQGVKHGMVHLSLTWLSLSTDYSDLEPALKETHYTSRFLHTALLSFYIDSAKNLPEMRIGTPPDAYVVLEVEGNSLQTDIVKHSNSPKWEQNFTLMLSNPRHATLAIRVRDKKTNNQIGEIMYEVDSLKNQPEMSFKKQSFTLKMASSECSLILSMSLKIFRVEEEEESNKDDNSDEETFTAIETIKKRLSEQASFDLSSLESPTFPRASIGSESIFSGNLPDLSEMSEGMCVKLTLRYSIQRRTLIVVVHKVSNIPLKNPSNLPDPYVKLYLLPEKSKESKRKTRVLKYDCNPVFDENFEYFLTTEDLKIVQLKVTVATERKYIGNNVIGQTVIDFSRYNKLTSPITGWFDLQEKNE